MQNNYAKFIGRTVAVALKLGTIQVKSDGNEYLTECHNKEFRDRFFKDLIRQNLATQKGKLSLHLHDLNSGYDLEIRYYFLNNSFCIKFSKTT